MTTTPTAQHPSPAARTARLMARRRAAMATIAVSALAFALFVLAMMIGSYDLTPWDVIASVAGIGDSTQVDYVVRELRLPDATTAVAAGAALGLAGTVFQKLLSNPLASPDFVGISAGSSLAAISGIVLWGQAGVSTSVLALIGAALTAGLIYILAWRDGITGYRFILIGIGISSFMQALISYFVARAQIHEAREAMTWLVGSVGQAGRTELRLLLVMLVVALPLALALTRSLHVLELGDDTAKALGSRVELSRLALLGLSIVLVGFATAAAGPLMFVALVSGPVAQRLVGGSAGGLIASAFVGASMVLGADLVAQHLMSTPVPTGVITGAIGAPYLIWLLATVNREGRGG